MGRHPVFPGKGTGTLLRPGLALRRAGQRRATVLGKEAADDG